MTQLVDHWSYSSIAQYLRCPWAWYKTYVEKVPRESKDVFKIGTALHYMLECNAIEFARTGKRLSQADSVLKFKEEWAKSHTLLVQSYFQADKWLEPMGEDFIEHKFKLDCFGVPLHGVIDIITKDERVVDYKTSKKPYYTHQVEESLQLSLYAGVYYNLFNKLPKKVGYQVIIKDYSGVQNLWDTRTLKQIEEAKLLVKKCDDEVNSKEIFEKKKGRLCPWCVYEGVCNNESR